MGMPRPSRAVKFFLLVNFGVFFFQLLSAGMLRSRGVDPLASVFGVTVGGFWQIWRYLTFQFLHDTQNFWHIALNMLGLYMLGVPLERLWGTRRFVSFYLVCGAAAGLAYVIIGASFGLPGEMPIVGASGGVYGIVLACAVLFPHFRIILILFPVPIRMAAIIVFGIMILTVLRSLTSGVPYAAMSDVAHLGGAVAAAVWLWGLPRLRFMQQDARRRIRLGAWEQRMREKTQQQQEIDRILQKIHDQGISSLTDKERETLKDTTDHQREDDRLINP
jgi:membrane associated rhomboid family serine protease